MSGKRILVLPVSGGAFPYQLGLIRRILLTDTTPHDLVLATSGGNVCANILNASGYDLRTYDRLIKKLDGPLFAKKWQEFEIIPDWIWTAIKGTAYQRSDLGTKLLTEIYSYRDPEFLEIWTSTMDLTKRRVQLWCNRASTALNFTTFDRTEVRCLNPKYLAGDVGKIAKLAMASAALPMFVDPVMIDRHLHRDGGVAYSSPLTPLRDVIVATYPEYHLDYISSYDMETSETADYSSLSGDGINTLQDILQSLNYNDRKVGLDLLRDGVGNPLHEEGICDHDTLIRINKIRMKYKRSMLELFPFSYKSIDIINIANNEVRDRIKSVAGSGCGYRLWLDPRASEKNCP